MFHLVQNIYGCRMTLTCVTLANPSTAGSSTTLVFAIATLIDSILGDTDSPLGHWCLRVDPIRRPGSHQAILLASEPIEWHWRARWKGPLGISTLR